MSKGSRNHRCFEDLTWAQCLVIRAVIHNNRYGLSRGSAQRAFCGLMGKRVQYIASTSAGVGLTPEGVKLYNRLIDWRPDLFKVLS